MDIADKHCKVCKKPIAVLYPTRWAYKQYDGKNHVKAWYCSWKCLREDEKKHSKPRKEKYKKIKEGVDELANVKHRDPAEVVMGMFAAMDSGEEPRAYLRKIGYKNPTDQLSHLRYWAAKHDKAALTRLNKIPRMTGSGRKAKAKASTRKIQKPGESLLNIHENAEPIAKTVEVKDTEDGGVRFTLQKLPPGSEAAKVKVMTRKNHRKEAHGLKTKPAVPAPLDGGEWIHEETPAEESGPVIKEMRLPDLPPRLRIAGLESRAIERATWVRTGEMIVFSNSDEMSMILGPKQWRELATEIELMLQQFGT